MKRIVQLVRRFGPGGGMETYAWQLTRALAEADEPVEVLCGVDASDGQLPIPVTVLGRSRARWRWRKHVDFSNQANAWAAQQPAGTFLLHSHEMVDRADVVTFHSTLHGEGAEKMWWKRLDPSWHANQWLERRVLRSAHCVVPVSSLLKNKLASRHGFLKDSLASAIPPGLEPTERVRMVDEPVIGFMGWEWKRKGLRRVVEIMRALPETKLIIAGPSREGLADLLKEDDRVEVLGMADRADFFRRIRLLIHPARLEAYGMVIPEAMARGIPVLVSDATGAAAEIDAAQGCVLPLNAPVADWVATTARLLKQPPPHNLFSRNWSEVAAAYKLVYERLSSSEAVGDRII